MAINLTFNNLKRKKIESNTIKKVPYSVKLLLGFVILAISDEVFHFRERIR